LQEMVEVDFQCKTVEDGYVFRLFVFYPNLRVADESAVGKKVSCYEETLDFLVVVAFDKMKIVSIVEIDRQWFCTAYLICKRSVKGIAVFEIWKYVANTNRKKFTAFEIRKMGIRQVGIGKIKRYRLGWKLKLQCIEK